MKVKLKKRSINLKNELYMSERVHQDGRFSFLKGYSENDNPYPFSDDVWSFAWVKWANWRNGWTFAKFHSQYLNEDGSFKPVD